MYKGLTESIWNKAIYFILCILLPIIVSILIVVILTVVFFSHSYEINAFFDQHSYAFDMITIIGFILFSLFVLFICIKHLIKLYNKKIEDSSNDNVIKIKNDFLKAITDKFKEKLNEVNKANGTSTPIYGNESNLISYNEEKQLLYIISKRPIINYDDKVIKFKGLDISSYSIEVKILKILDIISSKTIEYSEKIGESIYNELLLHLIINNTKDPTCDLILTFNDKESSFTNSEAYFIARYLEALILVVKRNNGIIE